MAICSPVEKTPMCLAFSRPAPPWRRCAARLRHPWASHCLGGQECLELELALAIEGGGGGMFGEELKLTGISVGLGRDCLEVASDLDVIPAIQAIDAIILPTEGNTVVIDCHQTPV